MMKQSPSPLIPNYAYLPLLTSFAFNIAVYSGSKLLIANAPHHSMAIGLDARIPFYPVFISVYILAYAQWLIGYVIIARESRALCYEILAADLVSKLICLVCFLVYPTTICRPVPSGGGIWNALTRLIYWFDTPLNLFPSIHCLKSWFCFRGALRVKQLERWYPGVTLVFSLLVFASTVLVKQHVVLDILGGVLAAEVGLFLSRQFHLGRIFVRFEPPSVRRSHPDPSSRDCVLFENYERKTK